MGYDYLYDQMLWFLFYSPRQMQQVQSVYATTLTVNYYFYDVGCSIWNIHRRIVLKRQVYKCIYEEEVLGLQDVYFIELITFRKRRIK